MDRILQKQQPKRKGAGSVEDWAGGTVQWEETDGGWKPVATYQLHENCHVTTCNYSFKESIRKRCKDHLIQTSTFQSTNATDLLKHRIKLTSQAMQAAEDQGAHSSRPLRPHLNGKKLGMVSCTCQPSYGRKHKIGGPGPRPDWAKSETPISKITRAERAGGMAEVEEHLPGKLKAPSSNPSTAKKYQVE
jgi:hypothetical protein